MSETSIKPEQAEHMPGIEPSVPAPAAHEAGERPRYKSYRKKYRKMKLNFDKLMEEANELFVTESKAAEIARRIQEQNDKLLDVLLEINYSRLTPTNRRYDLSSPSIRPSILPPPPRDESSVLPPPTKSLRSLGDIAAHTPFDLTDSAVLPADLQADAQGCPGYLSMEHEESYINAIDAKLESDLSSSAEAKVVDAKPPKPTLTERDFAVQNPVSVHNWLRKHQPQVFDSKDKESERGGKSPPPSRKKKAAKQEPTDTMDEDGDADSVAFGSAKVKRKRDDDAYRPKGGHSRPQKRKREAVEGESKTGKKPRKSNGGDEES